MAGGSGDPAEADAGDDVEQDEVAEAHDTGGCDFGKGGSGGQEEGPRKVE